MFQSGEVQKGFLHLVTGGSGSGKSAFAEDCVISASSSQSPPCQDLPRGGLPCQDLPRGGLPCQDLLRGGSPCQSPPCQDLPRRRIYIATMIPYGEDGRQRVERHRRLRAKKDFETIECYTGLERLRLAGASSDTIVLLECMSNLVANEMFEPGGAGEDTAAAILRGIESLRRQARHIVVVTNEVFSDGVNYDEETMRYLSCLGEVNLALAARADRVTEVVYGIPVTVKDSGEARA